MSIVRGSKFKDDDVVVEALNIVSSRISIHALIVGHRAAVNRLF